MIISYSMTNELFFMKKVPLYIQENVPKSIEEIMTTVSDQKLTMRRTHNRKGTHE